MTLGKRPESESNPGRRGMWYALYHHGATKGEFLNEGKDK